MDILTSLNVFLIMGGSILYAINIIDSILVPDVDSIGGIFSWYMDIKTMGS